MPVSTTAFGYVFSGGHTGTLADGTPYAERVAIAFLGTTRSFSIDTKIAEQTFYATGPDADSIVTAQVNQFIQDHLPVVFKAYQATLAKPWTAYDPYIAPLDVYPGYYAYVDPDRPKPISLTDPIRINASESVTGGFFIEPSLSEVVLKGSGLKVGDQVAIPDDRGRTLYTATVLRKEDQGSTEALSFETDLGFLNRVQPFASGYAAKGPFTPQQALQKILAFVQAQLPSLRVAPIPELVLRLPETQYTPSIPAILIRRPTDGSLGPSVREVIGDYLEAFEGYKLRPGLNGEVMIVPPEWLSGNHTPLSLSALDVTQEDPTVTDDGESIVNVVTVTSSAGEFAPGQPVLGNAWATSGNYFTVPVPVGAQDLRAGKVWPLLGDIVLGEGNITVTVNATVHTQGGGGGTRDVNYTGTVELPLSGTTVRKSYTINEGFGGGATNTGGVDLTYVPTANGGQGGVQVQPFGAGNTRDHIGQYWEFWWQFSLSGTAEAFTEGQNLSVTYGAAEDQRTDPSHALSFSFYGTRPKTLNLRAITLDVAGMEALARAYIRAHSQPTRIMQFGLTTDKVTPGSVNRLLSHPNGNVGVLEGYSFDFSTSRGGTQTRQKASLRITQNLATLPVTLPGGGTLTRSTERRYTRARWSFTRA